MSDTNKLNRYLAAWELSNPHLLTQTMTSQIYTVSRVLAFTYAYACLNASWWLRLGGSDIVEWSLKVAEIVEPYVEPLAA